MRLSDAKERMAKSPEWQQILGEEALAKRGRRGKNALKTLARVRRALGPRRYI